MKLRQLNENESTELAKDYIDYAKYGPLTGATFRVDSNQVVIYQETDESEDGLEEPTKYYVIKADVPIGIWNQFMNVVNANNSESGPNA